ncbi:hypothetical protein N305_10835, partial [Manacus vitellinus]
KGSPRIAELFAAVWVFETWSACPVNLITDSAYIAGLLPRLDGAYLKHVDQPPLPKLFQQLQTSLEQCPCRFFVMHIRSHTELPGFIAEGNALADSFASSAAVVVPLLYQQTRLSRAFFHQSAKAFVHQLKIKESQARDTMTACPDCQSIASGAPALGVNPQGLVALELWQSDVTHVPSFGVFKDVHVSIDTFSGAIFASAHKGEKADDVHHHWLQCVPQRIKTDNGPAHVSSSIQSFLQDWGVHHSTKIPHNPNGQAIVERAIK